VRNGKNHFKSATTSYFSAQSHDTARLLLRYSNLHPSPTDLLSAMQIRNVLFSWRHFITKYERQNSHHLEIL